jgi:hypothetical protein
MAVCKSCGAPIEWAHTKNGKRIPLDPGTVENGNITVADDGIAYIWPAGEGDRVSHFATCEFAKDHRKKR